MALVSESEIAALGEWVELGMTTPVSILTWEMVERDDSDSQNVWMETVSTLGWLWEPPDFPTGNDVGGVVGTAQDFRLYLKREVSVRPGDRVGVEGALYEVLNSNDANTFRPMTRVALRRVE